LPGLFGFAVAQVPQTYLRAEKVQPIIAFLYEKIVTTAFFLGKGKDAGGAKVLAQSCCRWARVFPAGLTRRFPYLTTIRDPDEKAMRMRYLFLINKTKTMSANGKHSKASTKRRLAAAVAEPVKLANKARFLGSVAWKTMAGAKQTDQAIRSRPYQSIGVAFGLGLLLGCLVTRNDS
jgi:ElaB/YqjD/DUF883 family membrane-anchored ribosome-binding protein